MDIDSLEAAPAMHAGTEVCKASASPSPADVHGRWLSASELQQALHMTSAQMELVMKKTSQPSPCGKLFFVAAHHSAGEATAPRSTSLRAPSEHVSTAPSLPAPSEHGSTASAALSLPANASSYDAAAIAPAQASLAPALLQDASHQPGTDAHLSPAMRTKQLLQRTMEARKKGSQTAKSVANGEALAGASKPVATPARAPTGQNPIVEAPNNPKVVGGDQHMDAAIAQCVREDMIAAMDEEHDDATVWGGDYESRSGVSLSIGSEEEQDLKAQ